MKAETRKGHGEEIEHFASRIIKTFKPGGRFYYDGTLNLLAISLFISLVRGNMDYWSVKCTFQRSHLVCFAYHCLIIDVSGFFCFGCLI